MSKEVALKYSNSKVIFAQGSFDEWCVYIVKNGNRTPPNDVDYFTFFKKLDSIYANNANNANQANLDVYADFVQIFDNTHKQIEARTLSLIDELVCRSGLTGRDKIMYEGYLVVIYMGMIAEENKAFTKLGKRVKRLGMYNLLKDGMTAKQAANASRGKNWRDLDGEMRARGF